MLSDRAAVDFGTLIRLISRGLEELLFNGSGTLNSKDIQPPAFGMSR